MLVLYANRELESTFQKLIQTTGARIAWNGRFVVIDNQMILEGKVRSLFFQFDTKKVLTNLIELTIEQDQVIEISNHPALQDLINMILYAFGKWGTLKGLRVEHDYTQLNQLFQKILHNYYIEPAFQSDNFRFYKDGKRITYEDVIETALQSEEKPEEDPEDEDWEAANGLWHRLIWKNRQRMFKKTDTTLVERVTDRIGNNFYLVGYQCPKCSEKLHMAVYPVGREQRIETEEGRVFIARVYTCSHCFCFFTPRPGRLLAEGYVYEMSFGDDKKAYEDYLELLGEAAARTANFQFNEYEAQRSRRLSGGGTQPADDEEEVLQSEEDAGRQMEMLSNKIDYLSEDEFDRFTHRIEEGFYPDAAVKKHEKKILEQRKLRRQNEEKRKKWEKEPGRQKSADLGGGSLNGHDGTSGGISDGTSNRTSDTASVEENKTRYKKYKTEKQKNGSYHKDDKENNISIKQPGSDSMQDIPAGAGGIEGIRHGQDGAASDKDKMRGRNFKEGQPGVQEQNDGRDDSAARQKKYNARLGVLERMSARQKEEFRKQVLHDTLLDEHTRQEILRPIEEARLKEKEAVITKKVDSCEHKNKSYAQIRRVMDEVEEETIPPQMKRSFLDRLYSLIRRRGGEEVRRLIEQAPEHLDRAGYQKLERQLEAYEEVDMSPYEETLRKKREEAEKQEIAGMVKRAPKRGRGDYVSLMARLEKQGFADENVSPYMDKIKERIQELDEERIDEICQNVQSMDFDTAAAAYDQIAQESFLPQIKDRALEMLSRRLEKIKTDECQLLVQKLQDEMQGTIRDNPRHHFYPARDVMLKKADPKQTRAIDRALSTYASGRSLFEYPIFAADTSRNHSGKDGMLLTPENLFYSTRLNSYQIPVAAIDSVSASTGLINRRITLEEKNGARHKLPYVVGAAEMKDWADIMEGFIKYLQEKPASRKLEYLAKEKHDTICCFRCGCIYQNAGVCPECGYKMNR